MTENKLAVRQEVSITAGMSREQLDLIKNTVARGATDNELKLFLYTGNRTQLDPLTKQIHFIKRRVWNSKTREHDEVGTIQTGIDGYRVVASRNGLAGIEDAVFDAEDKPNPNKASVTVYKMVNGTRVPFTASARWAEYVQEKDEYVDGKKTGKKAPAAMWAKMPYLMLAKVAEALALRKAFPNDLSGVYTNEEMAQADTEPVIDAGPEPMWACPGFVER
jgi:phage recombination protein Bet